MTITLLCCLPHRWVPALGCLLWLLVAAGSFAEETATEDAETTPTENGAEESLRERLWTEMASQVRYSHEDHNNTVMDSAVLSGVHAVKLNDQWVDVYAKTRLGFDSGGDSWNNRAEVGLGVRYRPFKSLGVVLFNEVARGRYFRGDLDDVEPDYWSDRLGAAFWQWWGRQPYQVEHTEFYLPFTGWREVYADAIYISDQSDVIANLAYKEGLMLGKAGQVRYDAHLSFEAGADTKGEYWCNYLKFGPGVRVAPFKDKDFNIGLDCLLGTYYRGKLEDKSRSFADLVVTLGFYYEF